jgi:hypothetical protein
MKYFNIKALNMSIARIRDGNTDEHRSGTAALGLARNYFSVEKFAITPEQIQETTRKRPDLAIEKFLPSSLTFTPHCFIEVKSLIRKSFDDIADQLVDTVFVAVDTYGNLTGNYSVYMIGIKGTKIAFYMYHSFSSLLDDYGIPNYRGLMPLNYLIPENLYSEFNRNFPLVDPAYALYKSRLEFETNPVMLYRMGALATKHFSHPHILDLLNAQHQEHIHNMFNYVEKINPNLIFKN